MDASGGQQDSPLSISANITGILTFVVAIVAAVYARVTYLRNSDDEYFRVKASLSWYKTESAWLANLMAALNAQQKHHDDAAPHSLTPEGQMYGFVMDDLLNLEERLLDLVAETEARAGAVRNSSRSSSSAAGWTLVPERWQGGRTSVAVAWLAVRTKALELMKQREGLTARVQFMQMSLISSRLRDLESRGKWREMKADESARKLEALVESQRDRIQTLEGLVGRLMQWDASLSSASSISRAGTLTNMSLHRFGAGSSGPDGYAQTTVGGDASKAIKSPDAVI